MEEPPHPVSHMEVDSEEQMLPLSYREVDNEEQMDDKGTQSDIICKVDKWVNPLVMERNYDSQNKHISYSFQVTQRVREIPDSHLDLK